MPEIKDNNLDVFNRMFAQIDVIEAKNQKAVVIYMSQKVAEELKFNCKDMITRGYINTMPDGEISMAKFLDIPIRRVLDCSPSYLHIVGEYI